MSQTTVRLVSLKGGGTSDLVTMKDGLPMIKAAGSLSRLDIQPNSGNGYPRIVIGSGKSVSLGEQNRICCFFDVNIKAEGGSTTMMGQMVVPMPVLMSDGADPVVHADDDADDADDARIMYIYIYMMIRRYMTAAIYAVAMLLIYICI